MEDVRFNKIDKNTQIGIVMRQTNYTHDELVIKFNNPQTTYTSIILEYLDVVKDDNIVKYSNNQQRYREYGIFLRPKPD